MKLYKLTDQNFETYNHTKWGESVTHKTNGIGEMCGPGWLHAYTSPSLAILLNPIHANTSNPVLWECEGDILKSDNGLKVGTTQLTTIHKIPIPQFTTNQRIFFALLCAQEVYKEPDFQQWAQNWIANIDRSFAGTAAGTAGTAGTARAAWAAWAAAEAAWAAAGTAEAAWAAARAAWAAAGAARAADLAAEAAAGTAEAADLAAEAAAWTGKIDLDALAKKALQFEV